MPFDERKIDPVSKLNKKEREQDANTKIYGILRVYHI